MPEMLTGNTMHGDVKKVDVYAFGITAYEILTGILPYAHINYHSSEAFCSAILTGSQPECVCGMSWDTTQQ